MSHRLYPSNATDNAGFYDYSWIADAQQLAGLIPRVLVVLFALMGSIQFLNTLAGGIYDYLYQLNA